MHIYETPTYEMTLLVAVRNSKNISIGSDTLASYTENGKTTYSTGFQKIFRLNKSTALMIDGYFDGAMKQFVEDFVDRYKIKTDLDELCQLVLDSTTRPAIGQGQKIQFCFVGFTNNNPNVKIVTFKENNRSIRHMMTGKCFATGFKTPSERAMELMNSSGVQNGLSTNQLQKLVKQTLEKCIKEFKDSESEKLGGNPDIFTLRK